HGASFVQHEVSRAPDHLRRYRGPSRPPIVGLQPLRLSHSLWDHRSSKLSRDPEPGPRAAPGSRIPDPGSLQRLHEHRGREGWEHRGPSPAVEAGRLHRVRGGHGLPRRDDGLPPGPERLQRLPYHPPPTDRLRLLRRPETRLAADFLEKISWGFSGFFLRIFPLPSID